MSGMDALRGASKQRDEFRRQDERVRQLKSQYDKGFKAGCDAQREEVEAEHEGGRIHVRRNLELTKQRRVLREFIEGFADEVEKTEPRAAYKIRKFLLDTLAATEKQEGK